MVSYHLTGYTFTLESAKLSLQKINDKVPPSDKNQQFKDGVIWADCMNLLQKGDVILVTKDKAFFQDRVYDNGLAVNLKEEAVAFANNIKIYSSLTKLLEEIKTDITIDNAALVSQFTEIIKESMNSILEGNGFSISSKAIVNISTFVTEDPDKLYIEFTIQFECIDERGEERTDGILLLKGDGYYAIDKKELLELRNRGEELSFNDGGEERKSKNYVILAGSIVLGHKNVEHSIKYRIE